jgi:hypothetical protein
MSVWLTFVDGHSFLELYFVNIVEVWSLCAETVFLEHEALLLLVLLLFYCCCLCASILICWIAGDTR